MRLLGICWVVACWIGLVWIGLRCVGVVCVGMYRVGKVGMVWVDCRPGTFGETFCISKGGVGKRWEENEDA